MINWVNIAGLSAILVSAFSPLLAPQAKKLLTLLSFFSKPRAAEEVLHSGDFSSGESCCLAANELVAVLLRAKQYDLAKEATLLAQKIGAAEETPLARTSTKSQKPVLHEDDNL